MSFPSSRPVAAPSVPMTYSDADTYPSLLIVDPLGAEQTPLLRLLLTEGLTVQMVANSRDAWALITQSPPNLILIEATLNHASGFTLCQRLQDSVQTRRIPVLFTGERADKGDRLRAFAAGGVDFIPKPYWPEEVIARLKRHLAHEQTQQRLQHYAQQTLANHGQMPLLANLQKTLHQQAVKLQEQNAQLQREIYERRQVEQALRQEQQKSEQLLLNILPEAIVSQLKQFQGSLAERFEEATVLFADLVDFTPLAAQYSPLELVNLLNQIFSAFDRLVERYHLEKIKTIGDAYMVVGGVPVPHADHAVAVADMALEMQTIIRSFRRDDDLPLQLRIGINTGTVVAGVIGIKKFSYDLWGDTVNVASRMESQGTADKIQVTASTYRCLADRFQFEPAQEIEIKGKGLMKTYYLLDRL